MMHNAVLRISFCGIWFSCVMAISHMNNLNACFHKNASPSSTELIVMFNLRNVFFCFSIFSMYHLRFWIHTGWSMFWAKLCWSHFPENAQIWKTELNTYWSGAKNAQIWKTEMNAYLFWGRLPSCSADSKTWLWIPPCTQNTRKKYVSWVYF